MARTTNQAGIELIESFEGLRLVSYQDQRGIWTIGYGHTRGVGPSMHITRDQAEQALRDDIAGAEGAVNRAIGEADTTDNQFAAMVSLCFNIGSGNFATSSVLRDHCAGDNQAAGDAFLLWNKTHIDGVLTVVAGLTRRREAERTLYVTP